MSSFLARLRGGPNSDTRSVKVFEKLSMKLGDVPKQSCAGGPASGCFKNQLIQGPLGETLPIAGLEKDMAAIAGCPIAHVSPARFAVRRAKRFRAG